MQTSWLVHAIAHSLLEAVLGVTAKGHWRWTTCLVVLHMHSPLFHCVVFLFGQSHSPWGGDLLFVDKRLKNYFCARNLLCGW